MNGGLNNIPSGAFSYNTSLENIVIPNNIQYILESAFEKCFVLKNVTFEENSKLILIGSKAFTSCNLQSISIPKDVVETYSGPNHNREEYNEIAFKIMNNAGIKLVKTWRNI